MNEDWYKEYYLPKTIGQNNAGREVQALSASASNTITVNVNNVVNAGFMGVGTNTLPMSFMRESINAGFTDAHWQLDIKRMCAFSPKVTRVWFQTDWMETAKGVYDFNSPKMQAFYKYLDGLLESGTEIYFNFGWKVSTNIEGWFGIPGITPSRNSAPRDLQAFAEACSAAVNHLINVKGYDIKYVGFYNEPNGFDFECFGDFKLYYLEMLKLADAQLKKDGLRNLIQLWGSDETGAIDWTQFMTQNASDLLDVYTFHDYLPYNRLENNFKSRVTAAGSKPVMMTEFGTTPAKASWAASNASHIIAAANHGLKGALHWALHGVYATDPLGYALDDDFVMWKRTYPDGGADAVAPAFYEVGLLSQYIPTGSSVLETTVSDGENMRATAFKTPDGNYTVAVEMNQAEADRALTVNFGANLGQNFGQHVFTQDMERNANALIPRRIKTFPAGSSISDTVGKERCLVVYTTLPALTQVEMSQVIASVDAGQTLALSATVIDNSGGVTWSVVSGQGTVSPTGVYTPSPGAASGSTAAVKAASAMDPNGYGITVVKIN
jgi:hypothetical protein